MEPTEVRARFERLARDLAVDGATSGIAFRRRALKVSGEAFLILGDDGVVIRLPDGCPSREDALAEPGAEVFTVEAGRVPVPDWVVLPGETAEHWPEWAHEAAKEAAATTRPRRPGQLDRNA
jgi:hypothetical protein